MSCPTRPTDKKEVGHDESLVNQGLSDRPTLSDQKKGIWTMKQAANGQKGLSPCGKKNPRGDQ
jgi:hypothetical protein